MAVKIINLRVAEEDFEFLQRQADSASATLSAFIRQELGLRPVENGGARPGAGRPPKPKLLPKPRWKFRSALTTSEADPA